MPFDWSCKDTKNSASPRCGTRRRMNSVAVFVERRDQVLGNHLSRTPLDHVALNEMYQVTVLEQGNRRRGWRIRQQMFAQTLDGIYIETRKSGRQLIRALLTVVNRHQCTGTGTSGASTANGVDDDQGGSGGSQRLIHRFRRQEFVESILRQFLLHRYHNLCWIHSVCLFCSKTQN